MNPCAWLDNSACSIKKRGITSISITAYENTISYVSEMIYIIISKNECMHILIGETGIGGELVKFIITL